MILHQLWLVPVQNQMNNNLNKTKDQICSQNSDIGFSIISGTYQCPFLFTSQRRRAGIRDMNDLYGLILFKPDETKIG